MKGKLKDVDAIEIKQKPNVWKRFVKIFPKCRLPWPWILLYVAVELIYINFGVIETDYTAQLFSNDVSSKTVATLIGVLIFNLFLSNIMIFLREVASAYTNRNMRVVLLDKVMRLPLSYFKDDNPQDAIYRITNNATVIDSTVMAVIIPMCMAVVQSAAVFAKVFQYDWRLSLTLLVFIPLQVFMAFLFGRLNFSVSQKDSNLSAKLTEKLAEMIRNIPMAKAFAKESQETKRGEEYVDRLYKINIKGSWLDQIKNLSETGVELLQSLVMSLVAMMLINGGEINARAWITFFMFSSIFNGAVAEFLMYWNNVKIIQGGAERLCEIMDAEEETYEGEPCSDLKGPITVRDLHFAYGEEDEVLKGIDCVIPDKGVTALLGKSGCGKTTFINLITRLYDPASGQIEANGKNVAEYALDSYREQFVVVPQNPMLFSGTIRDNLMFGNKEVSEEKIVEALKLSKAYDFVEKMPKGIDTVLEEYGGNLSGGQRQRLALARALLSNAHYFVFDEPTASLDISATAELMGILNRIAADHSVVIIAHTSAVLSAADNIITIDNGKVSFEGTVENARRDCAFVRSLMGEEADR